MDLTFVGYILTALTTAFGAWLLHRRETKRVDTAGEVATAAMHLELDGRMQDHVNFVEARIQAERRWYEQELDRERKDCAASINALAGRLGIAESRLRDFQRTKRISWEGGVSSEEPEGDSVEGSSS